MGSRQRGRAWAVAGACCLVGVICGFFLACTYAGQSPFLKNESGAEVVLIVDNYSSSVIRVSEAGSSRYFGRVTPGIDQKVTLSGLQNTTTMLVFRLVGGESFYVPSPSSGTLISQPCWYARVDFLNPEFSANSSFVPCSYAGKSPAKGDGGLGEASMDGAVPGVGFMIWRAKRILDPSAYRYFYHMTEGCLGVTGDADAVDWWVASAIHLPELNLWATGLHFTREDGVPVIVLESEYILNLETITHEIIHDITGLPDPLPEEIKLKCQVGYKPEA